MAEVEFKPCDSGFDPVAGKVIKWDNFMQRLLRKAYADRNALPVDVTCELTPLCSLRCNMCFARLEKSQRDAIGKELTTQQWIDLITQAAENGALSVLLTGGECMLREDFCEIYEAASKLGLFIFVYTNATLVTDKIVELFRRRPPIKVSVTLYGASPDTYEKVCGVREGFERTLAGLDKLRSIPGIDIEIKMTVTQENKHEVREVAKIAYERYNTFLRLGFSEFMPSAASSRGSDEFWLSAEEKLIAQQDAFYHDFGDELEELVKSSECFMDEKTAQAEYNEDMTEFSKHPEESFAANEQGMVLVNGEYVERERIVNCSAGRAGVSISWQGRLLPCQVMVAPYELPLEIGYKEACVRIRRAVEKIVTPARCLKCLNRSECGACAASIQSNTGSFDKEPTDCRFTPVPEPDGGEQ